MPGWCDVPLAALAQEKSNCRRDSRTIATPLDWRKLGTERDEAARTSFTPQSEPESAAASSFDGKIYHGRHGAAAEGGHMTIRLSKPNEVRLRFAWMH